MMRRQSGALGTQAAPVCESLTDGRQITVMAIVFVAVRPSGDVIVTFG
jgi:hypothetical protein